MDVQLTLDAATCRSAAWPYRLVEGAVLTVLIYGLAASLWWLAAVGGITAVLTYAVYRHRHGSIRTEDDDGSLGDDSGGD